VVLYPDSGSTVNVAGTGYERVQLQEPDEFAMSKAVGAGGHTINPVFTGIADLFFPAVDTFATHRIADFSGGANYKSGGGHVMIVTMDSPGPHSSVFMLDGPLTKVDSALGTDSRMNGV